MKLADLGLKTKPATKYVEGGFISFRTENKELFYKIVVVTKTKRWTLDVGVVADKSHLDVLLGGKTIKQYMELLNQ